MLKGLLCILTFPPIAQTVFFSPHSFRPSLQLAYLTQSHPYPTHLQPEDGTNMFFWNVGVCPKEYMVLTEQKTALWKIHRNGLFWVVMLSYSMDRREVPLPALKNHIPLQYTVLCFQAELTEWNVSVLIPLVILHIWNFYIQATVLSAIKVVWTSSSYVGDKNTHGIMAEKHFGKWTEVLLGPLAWCCFSGVGTKTTLYVNIPPVISHIIWISVSHLTATQQLLTLIVIVIHLFVHLGREISYSFNSIIS